MSQDGSAEFGSNLSRLGLTKAETVSDQMRAEPHAVASDTGPRVRYEPHASMATIGKTVSASSSLGNARCRSERRRPVYAPEGHRPPKHSWTGLRRHAERGQSQEQSLGELGIQKVGRLIGRKAGENERDEGRGIVEDEFAHELVRALRQSRPPSRA